MERNARNDVARTAKEQTQVQLVPSFSIFSCERMIWPISYTGSG